MDQTFLLIGTERNSLGIRLQGFLGKIKLPILRKERKHSHGLSDLRYGGKVKWNTPEYKSPRTIKKSILITLATLLNFQPFIHPKHTHIHTQTHIKWKGLCLPLTICFSVYLLELSRLTASMWPKSISWPSRKMKSSLHTYFFLLYPSSTLSPVTQTTHRWCEMGMVRFRKP